MHTGNTCLTLFFLTITLVASKNITDNCKVLYDRGVEAYLENNYDDCITYLEDAIEAYRDYQKMIHNCRLKCHREADTTEPLYHFNVEDLFFFEKTVKNTLCIIQCKDNGSFRFEQFNLDRASVKIFEDRKPYEYLNICYFQNKLLQKAASAAFTFLVRNPNDDTMLANLRYYSNMPDVYAADVINFEAKDYVYLYVHGMEEYRAKRWSNVIMNMEESISSYLESEEECRAECEGPFNQGWLPDFIPAIANHFTYTLRCKRKCKDTLSALNGDKIDDFFASHYHYLQYAYHKVGKLKSACEAVASYLLFHPHDETMLTNVEYYMKLPKVEKEFFVPRTEAVHYNHRERYEQNLMEYIFNKFNVKTATMQKTGIYNPYVRPEKRFVVDNFINKEDCLELFQTASKYSINGDGYKGHVSPHSKFESYEGLSLSGIEILFKKKLLNEQNLRIIEKTSINVKNYLVKRFNIHHKLHFTFTHLVCRSSLPGIKNRIDLSHEVHADNCNLQVDGSCPKKPPSFTWRDFTAILYLNSNFSGGELFFSQDYYGRRVDESIRPTCGRLVGFTSGKENLHGVKAIINGTRCALALWFTFDERHTETERDIFDKL